MTGTATGVVVLALSGLLLVAVGLATARRPAQAVPTLDGYLDAWTPLHGGYDPRAGNPFVRGWLTMVYGIGRPLARRGVHPDVVTLSALWLAGAVLALAGAGSRWPLLAGLLLVASGLLDTLDGCVAVLSRRTTRWGYVLDSAVDRVVDVMYLGAVVAAGAPLELAVACGFLFFFLEYVRARAGNAGGDEVGRITVGERPNRVIFLAVALVAGGVFPHLRELAATTGTVVLALLSLVGVVQLLVTVRRQLLAQA